MASVISVQRMHASWGRMEVCTEGVHANGTQNAHIHACGPYNVCSLQSLGLHTQFLECSTHAICSCGRVQTRATCVYMPHLKKECACMCVQDFCKGMAASPSAPKTKTTFIVHVRLKAFVWGGGGGGGCCTYRGNERTHNY